jgi:hypothetical protein
LAAGPNLHISGERTRRAIAVASDQDRGIADAGALPKRALDLSQLDPLAAQLDLVILASQKFHEAVRPPPSEIAGLESPQMRIGRFDGKHPRRQFGIAPISQRDMAA